MLFGSTWKGYAFSNKFTHLFILTHLIIGTHYDADHLEGLVPIIKDEKISIGEAWLPPVANDSQLHAFDEKVTERHLLARQFDASNGHQVLMNYLAVKQRVCERLKPPSGEAGTKRESPQPWTEEYFKQQRDEILQELEFEPNSYNHADDERFSPRGLRELVDLIEWHDSASRQWLYRWWRQSRDADQIDADMIQSVAGGSTAAHNLNWIRKAAADDAINAISLNKVVEALRARQVRIACHIIPDGTPRRFVWSTASRRFEGGVKLPGRGPEITLLGPSEGLVKKHWNRLPIDTYASIATYALIPIKGITPSNQLSYVARFEAKKQGILVAGDAGCVDFSPEKNEPYYQELLAALRRLHVVQVAHHAGNNAHFYRVLLAAKYGQQTDPSYLLLSHAVNDSHRPSCEFNRFMEQIRRDDENVRILFTSQPTLNKVCDYQSLVYPAVGEPAVGQPDKVGDVRLVFGRKRWRGRWRVDKHAIGILTRGEE